MISNIKSCNFFAESAGTQVQKSRKTPGYWQEVHLRGHRWL